MPPRSEPERRQIAEYNDDLRQSINLHDVIFSSPKVWGLTVETKLKIVELMKNYSDFDHDRCDSLYHNWGEFKFDAKKHIWNFFPYFDYKNSTSLFIPRQIRVIDNWAK